MTARQLMLSLSRMCLGGRGSQRVEWASAVVDRGREWGAGLDSAAVGGRGGGHKAGRSRVDRGRPGRSPQVTVGAHGIRRAAPLTGGNPNDVTQLIPVIQAVPPIRGKRGRPRRRPDAVYADRGYDHDKYRRQVRELGIEPLIARRGTAHGSGLGVYRWVVEATIALLHWFRR